MLTLADASIYFDQTPVLDADTGRTLFYGQVDPYSDAMRDSATAYRRILSVKPGTVIPASRSVRILGAVWIVGDSELDGMAGAHRQKFVLHPGDEKFKISRLSGFLTGVFVANPWGSIEWTKNTKQEGVTSSPVQMYNLYVPAGTDVQAHDVVWTASRALLVSVADKQPSGVTAAYGEMLANPVATATVVTRTYAPSTGTYTTASSASVSCLKVRWQSLYVYDTQMDAKYQEGDCVLVFPAGTSITTASTVTLGAKTWAVLTVETIGGALVVHGRAK